MGPEPSSLAQDEGFKQDSNFISCPTKDIAQTEEPKNTSTKSAQSATIDAPFVLTETIR